MQTHIINNRNISFYTKQMEEIFRQRHQLFVEELGWKALSKPSGLDIDEFDHEHAVYVAVINDVGGVEGSCRLSPTLHKNLSADKLSNFFDEPIPKGIDIWDCSRWVGGKGNRRKLYDIAGYMWLGLHEFCLNYGIKSVTGVASPQLLNMTISLGISVTPLGLPKEYDEGTASGIHIKVSKDNLPGLRERFKIMEAASFELTSHFYNRGTFTPHHFSAISQIMTLSDKDDLSKIIEFCGALHTSKLNINAEFLLSYVNSSEMESIQ